VRQVVLSLALASICAVAQDGVRAQALNDPMRPSGASNAQQSTGASVTPELQVVITSPSRNLAVIDGTVVPLGASVRGATLANVSDSVAVLARDGSRAVVLMHPNIEKKPSRRERQ
jgi:hypothetical protein